MPDYFQAVRGALKRMKDGSAVLGRGRRGERRHVLKGARFIKSATPYTEV